MATIEKYTGKDGATYRISVFTDLAPKISAFKLE